MSQETQKTDEQPQPVRRRDVPIWLRPVLAVCDSVYRFFLIAAAVLTIVLLAAVVAGKSFSGLDLIVTFLGLTTTLGFVTCLSANYESYAPGIIGALIGAAFKFGSPFFFVFLASKNIIRDNDETLKSAYETLPSLGLFVLVLSIIALITVFIINFTGEHTAKQVHRYKYIDTSNTDTVRRSIVPRCWQMSRCRPAVRMTCPNYLDRKTCWKRRSGCFCDRELANYLVGSVDRKDVQEVIDMQVTAGSQQQKSAEIRGHLEEAVRRPWKLQRTLCYSCPLFIEHQEYKYKHLSWVSIPASIGIIAALYVPYTSAYTFLAQSIDNMVDKMIANMPNFPENLRSNSHLTDAPFFMWFLLAVLGLLFTSYVIAFVEKLFLKWQL